MNIEVELESIEVESQDLDNPVYQSFLATFLAFMMFFFIVAALIEKHKPPYGH